MKAIPDCVPDALDWILSAARAISEDDFIHRKVLLTVMARIAEDGDLGSNPADVYLHCWEEACRALGVKDPYENEKARVDKTALGILKTLSDRFPDGGNGLKWAIQSSLAGAMLDFRGLGRVDVQARATTVFQIPPVLDESPALETAFAKAETLMIVTHRAGEIALDRPLVEAAAYRGKRVFLAVSAKPVFLMATENDAELVGLPSGVEVVDPGTAMFGLAPDRASSEFRELLAKVDMVIVKGQVHFTTMALEREVFFILRVSEAATAERLGVGVGQGAVIRTPADRRN
ncbi:MAG: ARMT1-like domain-containing protein [Planctomycetota bacterium]|jgi:uncharacterized protein with ATP-grasp and redox domains|nr:ARMT1-like domain-containing protein [Planctomycetota bacterium]